MASQKHDIGHQKRAKNKAAAELLGPRKSRKTRRQEQQERRQEQAATAASN